jgi:hypothetical protein
LAGSSCVAEALVSRECLFASVDAIVEAAEPPTGLGDDVETIGFASRVVGARRARELEGLGPGETTERVTRLVDPIGRVLYVARAQVVTTSPVFDAGARYRSGREVSLR